MEICKKLSPISLIGHGIGIDHNLFKPITDPKNSEGDSQNRRIDITTFHVDQSCYFNHKSHLKIINMKKLACICLFGLLFITAHAQVGVGTTTPHVSAALDISSTTKGVLIPRMTTEQRDAIATPLAGLQILNLDDYCLDIYDGTGWIKNCGFKIIGTDTAQATMGTIANYGGGARTDAVAFSIGTKGYVGTGHDGTSNKKDFWEFDPATNTWTQKADFGGTARTSAVGFSINTKGYIGTGLDGAYKSDFWEYDPSTNAWTQKAGLPASGRVDAVGFSIGGNGYIGTGLYPPTDNMLSDMWEYYPASNHWANKIDFPWDATSLVAFSNSTYGYVGIGEFRSSLWGDFLDQYFYQFNPAGSGTWTQMPNFPGSDRHSAIGVSIGAYGYVGTGKPFPLAFYNDLYEFNTNLNTWTAMPNLSISGRAYATAFAVNGVIYIGTGYDGTPKSDFAAFERFPSGPAYAQTLDLSDAGSISDGMWRKELNKLKTEHLIDINTSGRTLSHPANRPFYVTGSFGDILNGAEFRRNDGKYGIGIGTNYLYAAGSEPSGTIGLAAKGVDGNVAFYTNGSQKMVLTAGGNLGIGLYPHAPLQLASTLANRKFVLYETVNNDHQFFGLGVNTGLLRYQVGSTANDHVFYAGVNATTSTELMRIKGNGNVGIGSSAPNAPLQFSNTIQNRKIVLNETANNDHQFAGMGYNTNVLRFQSEATTSDHVFYAGVNSTTSNELLRIKGNGNVGIGTSAPNASLQFANALQNRKIVLYEGANNDHEYYGLGINGNALRYQVDNAASNHVFYAATGSSASTELMRIQGNGSVGIGTSPANASAILDVSSTTKGVLIPRMTTAQRTAVATPATGLLVFDITTNSFWFRGSSSWLELSDNLDTEVFRNGPDKIYMALTDSVGIGTNNPAYKLDVKTSSNNYGISHTDGDRQIATWVGDGGEIGTVSNHSFRLFANNGINQFTLLPNGNIGINLSSVPANRFDIAHGAARSGLHATGRPLYVTGTLSDASNGVEIRDVDGTQGVGLGRNTVYAAGSWADQNIGLAGKGVLGCVLMSTNGTERVRVSGAGNVGIGNMAPHAPLHFANSTANRKIVLFEQADNNHQYYGFGVNGNILRYQVDGLVSDHVFYAASGINNSNELMRIKGDGNVTISGSVAVESFIAPTLLNGFSNYGFGYANVGYYKDKMGRVFLRGMVNNVNNPTGLIVFNLPAGYRPSASGRLVYTTTSNATMGRVDVMANGDVVVQTGTAGWISLDGISFKAD